MDNKEIAEIELKVYMEIYNDIFKRINHEEIIVKRHENINSSKEIFNQCKAYLQALKDIKLTLELKITEIDNNIQQFKNKTMI